jgi:spermidine/putrescine-binding protein
MRGIGISRILSVGLIAVVLVSGGIGYYLGSQMAVPPTKKLHIETFGGAYRESVWEVYAGPFAAKYGVEITFGEFYGGAEIRTKIEGGAVGIDVAWADFANMALLAKGGFLYPLRIENLPNFKNLIPTMRDARGILVNGTYYGVGNDWGGVGIAYNPKIISPAPTSCSIFWDERYKGRMAMMSAPTSIVPNIAVAIGEDPNNITDLDAIIEKLTEMKPLMKKFYTSHTEWITMYTADEIDIVWTYLGRVNVLRDEGVDIEWLIPKEGTYIWVEGPCIPKGSQNRDLAEKFIDFVLEAKNQEKFGLYAPCVAGLNMTEAEAKRRGYYPEAFTTPGSKMYIGDAEYSAKHEKEWAEKVLPIIG